MQACGEAWAVDNGLLLLRIVPRRLLELCHLCRAVVLLVCPPLCRCNLPLLLDVRYGCCFRCVLEVSRCGRDRARVAF